VHAVSHAVADAFAAKGYGPPAVIEVAASEGATRIA